MQELYSRIEGIVVPLKTTRPQDGIQPNARVPNFVTTDGVFQLLETKGLEDTNVIHKDRTARLWCENATRLTGNKWVYLKIREHEFDKLTPDSVADLKALADE